MRARKRLFWVALATVIVVAVGGVFWLSPAHAPPPLIITDPDGVQFQFEGATYGTNAMAPSPLVKIVNRLPKPLADFVLKHAGARTNQIYLAYTFNTPQLFVWFKRVGTNAAAARAYPPQGAWTPTAFLANEEGGVAGEQDRPNFAAWGPVWTYAYFPTVPRRSKVIECVIYGPPDSEGSTAEIARIRFANPAFGHFPQWKPEPLPTVKKSEDLEVRLDGVLSGSMQNDGTIASRKEGQALRVTRMVTSIDYSLRSARGTNEKWILQSAEVSDATGNRVAGQLGDGTFGAGSMAPGTNFDRAGQSASAAGSLWPDETAWRLKLSFKRSYGFDSNELVTFRNVPIPAMGMTDPAVISNTVGGRPILLEGFARHADFQMWGWIDFGDFSHFRIVMPHKPADLTLDVLKTTTDAGEPRIMSMIGLTDEGDSHSVMFETIPTNATKMDVTVLVQKVRTVEFTVKPGTN